MSKPKTIPVPIHLCTLLTSEPSDFTDPAKHADVTAAARAMLRLLVEVHTAPEDAPKKRTRRRRGMPEQPALHEPTGN
jgi:hypothetical protein